MPLRFQTGRNDPFRAFSFKRPPGINVRRWTSSHVSKTFKGDHLITSLCTLEEFLFLFFLLYFFLFIFFYSSDSCDTLHKVLMQREAEERHRNLWSLQTRRLHNESTPVAQQGSLETVSSAPEGHAHCHTNGPDMAREIRSGHYLYTSAVTDGAKLRKKKNQQNKSSGNLQKHYCLKYSMSLKAACQHIGNTLAAPWVAADTKAPSIICIQCGKKVRKSLKMFFLLSPSFKFGDFGFVWVSGTDGPCLEPRMGSATAFESKTDDVLVRKEVENIEEAGKVRKKMK